MKDLDFYLPKISQQSRNGSNLDPLDGRYFDAETARYLSEEARIMYQAYVEAALAQTLAEFNVCPQSSANEIEEAAQNVTLEAVAEEEKNTKHDIKALVNVIKSQISNEAKPYVHLTATSYDIVSTASSAQYRDAAHKVILPRLQSLLETLIAKAELYAETIQIGRTHGQHGVPITCGFALSEYIERLGQSMQKIEQVASELPGKFSGAVGAYNASGLFFDDPLAFEKRLLAKIGLTPAPHSTQIVPAESMVRLLDELTNAAGIMANLAHDVRHLQRSEIAEVREAFDPNQTGSSTMAHKRNPISFENVASQFKQVLGQLVSAKLNLTSEHQRDLTDSASARYYPVLIANVAYMAKRLQGAMAKLEIDNDAMQHNLHMSAGAISAEPLYLLLAKYGHTAAHEKAKALAHKAMDEKRSFVSVIEADDEAKDYWSRFTDTEKSIIAEPETHYTGLSAARTRTITQKWQQHLSSN